MPTILLRQAIEQGNVAQVRALLQRRDAQGIPIADVNHVTTNSLIRTGVLYALAMLSSCVEFPNPISSQSAYEIINLLLDIYNNEGNPVIDLNVQNGLRSNALGYVLSQYWEGKLLPAHARGLVERLTNLRKANGERACDISHNGWVSSLILAVMSNDAHIVHLLLDLREADGRPAIDVNYQLNNGRNCTALDVALQGSYWGWTPPHFRPNPEIVAMLRAAGARSATRNVANQIHIPTPVIPQPEPGNAEARFAANVQNTHLPEVERTVDLSIESLKEIYYNKKGWPVFTAVQNEISKYISIIEDKNVFSSSQLKHIKAGFKFICLPSSNITHVQSNLTMHEILMLVWLGVNDSTRILDCPQTMLPESFNELRRQALLEKFEAIVTTYYHDGEFRPACLGGTRNLLIDSLNKAHPAVFIAPTVEAAQEQALEYMKSYLGERLSQLPMKEQRSMLHAWINDVPEESLAAQSLAAFKEKEKENLLKLLKKHLGLILSQEWFAALEENFAYVPVAITHLGLRRMYEKIASLNVEAPPSIHKLSRLLKNAALTIFADSQRTYQEDAQLLSDYYSSFCLVQQLNSIVSKIKEMINPSAQELTSSLQQSIEHLCNIEDIAELSERTKIYARIIELFGQSSKLDECTINKALIIQDEARYGAFSKEISNINELLQDIPSELSVYFLNLAKIINAMKNYAEKLKKDGRSRDANDLSDLTVHLQKEIVRFIHNKQFDAQAGKQLQQCCLHQIKCYDFTQRHSSYIAQLCASILRVLGKIIHFPVFLEKAYRKDGLSFFVNKTNRQQYVEQLEKETSKITEHYSAKLPS